MGAVKAEPTSPGKPVSPSTLKKKQQQNTSNNGKGKEREQHGHEHGQGKENGAFGMSDWVQDYTLLDKMGGDTTMANLGDPVKTIEVGVDKTIGNTRIWIDKSMIHSYRTNGNYCQHSWPSKVS